MTNAQSENSSNIENITFGVELETIIPANVNLAIGAYHNGIPVEFAPKFGQLAWTAEKDGSIRIETGFVACEFVSPVLQGEAGVAHLLDFVAWLNGLGARVNASCGMHVHVGVASFCSVENQPLSPAKAAAKFVKILSRLASRNSTAFYAQTGTVSREQGIYCKRANKDVRKQITKACKAERLPFAYDRYQLLNLTNVTTRKTVEFRCFAGTLNPHKILCHLLSVFLLCKVAAGRKSLTNWDPKEAETLTGTQALSNLIKSRPTFTLVSARPFRTHRDALLKAGFDMAAKYDAAKAALKSQQQPAPYVHSLCRP